MEAVETGTSQLALGLSQASCQAHQRMRCKAPWIWVCFFPKCVVRSRFSAGVNPHAALEENRFSSAAALKKRALGRAGEAQHFSHASSLGFISVYVNFCLSTSRGTAFAGVPGQRAPNSHVGDQLRHKVPSGSPALQQSGHLMANDLQLILGGTSVILGVASHPPRPGIGAGGSLSQLAWEAMLLGSCR